MTPFVPRCRIEKVADIKLSEQLDQSNHDRTKSDPSKTLRHWWVLSRPLNSSKSLIFFSTLAGFLVAFSFLKWAGHASSLDPDTNFSTELAIATPTRGEHIATPEAIGQNSDSIDLIIAQREIEITRKADERLLQAVYFTIATVLTAAGVIGAFGWFSASRVSEMEREVMRREIDAAKQEVKRELKQIEDDWQTRLTIAEFVSELRHLGGTVAQGNVSAALNQAKKCAALLLKCPVGRMNDERFDFDKQLGFLFQETHRKIAGDEKNHEDPGMNAHLFLLPSKNLLDELRQLYAIQPDVAIRKRIDELQKIIQELESILREQESENS